MSTDKILFEDSKFWLLRGVPQEPQLYPNPEKYSDAMLEYYKALESCKSNKLEIVNPETVLIGDTLNSEFHWSNGYAVKPGDIFSLPEGYGFEEDLVYPDVCKTFEPRLTEVDQIIYEEMRQPTKILRLVKLSGTTTASEVNSVCNFTEDRNYPEAILFTEWLLREKTTEYLVGDFQGEMEEVYKEFIQRKKTS